MRFWGVTGTNGKTTTTWIFAEFLNHSSFDSNPNTQTPSNPNTSLYCLHELVHNEIVVGDLKARGFTFVEDVNDIPEGATVLFSAHGVDPGARHEAVRRGLKTIDATCPFVARVHRQVCAYAARRLPVVVVGHAAHVEVMGVVAEARAAGAQVAVVANLVGTPPSTAYH